MNELFNLDIERGILADIIFNGSFDEIKNILNKDDFYSPKHQDIYEAMEILNKKDYPIDEVMIKEELTKNNKFDETSMLEIIATAPIIMIETYAKEIKEYSIKRKLIEYSNLIKRKTLENSDINSLEIISNLKKDLEDLENNNSFDDFNFVDFDEVENREIEFILKEFLPIPKKAVTLLSARGGAGKSWLVLQLALRYINQNPNKKVFAWLSEDPTFATKKRAEKILNEVLPNYKDINDPIYKNFKYLGSETRPFHFIETNKSNSINNLFYKLKNSLKDFDFIILDPLIAFFGGDENNNSQAREFMNLLTEWADLEDKAILVVHHNNKNNSGNGGGIRGASAFVDAVRLQYELKTLTDDKKKNSNDKETILSNKRKIEIIKDNWGAERFIGNKFKEVSIFGSDLKKEGVEYEFNPNSKDKSITTYQLLLKRVTK